MLEYCRPVSIEHWKIHCQRIGKKKGRRHQNNNENGNVDSSTLFSLQFCHPFFPNYSPNIFVDYAPTKRKWRGIASLVMDVNLPFWPAQIINYAYLLAQPTSTEFFHCTFKLLFPFKVIPISGEIVNKTTWYILYGFVCIVTALLRTSISAAPQRVFYIRNFSYVEYWWSYCSKGKQGIANIYVVSKNNT